VGEEARQGRPGHDCDIDPLAGVLGDTVEGIEELGARRTRQVLVG
jgi:hypothetical protein